MCRPAVVPPGTNFPPVPIPIVKANLEAAELLSMQILQIEGEGKWPTVQQMDLVYSVEGRSWWRILRCLKEKKIVVIVYSNIWYCADRVQVWLQQNYWSINGVLHLWTRNVTWLSPVTLYFSKMI